MSRGLREWRHTIGFLAFAAACAHDSAYEFTAGASRVDAVAAAVDAAALAWFAWWARPRRSG